MIEKLLAKLKPREGTVTNVKLLEGFIDRSNHYHKYYNVRVRGINGYTGSGKPIIDEYIMGMYRITVTDSKGKEHQVEHYGKPPVIGSQMRIRGK